MRDRTGMGYVGEVRRMNRHRREILSCSFVGAVLFWIIVDVVVARSGRWSRGGSAHGNFDNESFIDRLTAGVVGFERRCDGLFGAQSTFIADILVVLFAADYLEGDVWGIDAAPERVRIFLQNDIADIVD